LPLSFLGKIMDSPIRFAAEIYVRVANRAQYWSAFVRLHCFGHNFKVGDIVCKRGGYQQEYHQVVALERKTRIVLRPIAVFIRPANEYTPRLQPNAVPAKDHFIGPERAYPIKIDSVWQGPGNCPWQPVIDVNLARFRRDDGYATFHPYLPNCPGGINSVSPKELSSSQKCFPLQLVPFAPAPSECIEVPDFDAFCKANDERIKSAI
jgi:hypothetical protein